MSGPFTPVSNGLRVAVRLTPKASRNGIEGLAPDANGDLWLKVSVTAVPEKNKANGALLKLLAKAWRCRKSDLSIVAGATDRYKTILIAGDPATLTGQLEQWMKEGGS
ncbi:DUF167 family protein [Magnetospira sp. QH-2]|uniref:DUF167 family protein n=1 Tax=Magnetospira sp. (strain QH-2) TaxID=1288970 RepID=UPI00208FEEBF|nr:DUF167 family protein [Magnetospira sp. QH-2]